MISNGTSKNKSHPNLPHKSSKTKDMQMKKEGITPDKLHTELLQ